MESLRGPTPCLSARDCDREQVEALRRSSPTAETDARTSAVNDIVVVRPVLAGLGSPRAGPGSGGVGAGVARGISPSSLLAMQRLAGNRATVQAVGRIRRSGTSDMLGAVDDEETADGAPATTGGLASPKERDVAAGPPDGGGPPGGAGSPGGPGAPGGGDGSPSARSGEKASLKPDVFAGAPTTKPELLAKAVKAGSGPPTGAAAETSPPARKTDPPPIVTGAAGGAGTTAAGPTGGAPTAPLPAGGAGTAPATALTTAAGPAPGAQPAPGAGAQPAPGPGIPGLTPAPAPAPTPATGPGGVPDPETARTNIDWNKILADFGPPVRTVLEVGRLIPGWGLLSGLGADSINFASDLAAIPNSENAELTTDLVIFRNFLNIGNNGVGHVLYVNQLIQDGLAGSVVGAEFVPLTAAANEVLSGVKVGLDEVQMGTDIIIEVEALYQSNHAPTSAEAEQWRALADGYAANILGDIVNLTLDVISLASAGAANTAPVQQARQPLTLAGAFMKNAAPNIIAGINGVLGVWLGTLITEGRHAYEGTPTELRDRALAYDLAGGFVDGEALRARTTYDTINFVIEAFQAYADQQIEQINAVAMALSGGKTAFELVRDAVQAGLQDMTRKLEMVERLGALASDAQTNAAAISEACAGILDTLNSLVMPDVELPEVELGEGIVAGAAEAIANEAVAAANAAIRATMATVTVRIEGVKDEIRGPVEAVQERSDDIGEWLALLATQCTAMAATLNGHITRFSEGLGRCTNAEQVIDLIIGEISELTGMPRFTVQELRDMWRNVGGYIDQFVALGPRLHQHATDLRAQADLLESGAGAGPTFALPPGPPQEPPPGGSPALLPGALPPPGAGAAPVTAVA
jgi:hypothetical protein